MVENFRLFDHFVVEGGSHWLFRVTPGTYGLAAFADRNADLIYQPGEDFLRVDPQQLIACGSGEEKRDIALIIPENGRPRISGDIDITALQARTVKDQFAASLGLLTAAGAITTLSDPRFSLENAASGLWAPFDFIFNFQPGVYLLQAYDPNKIPVLFVHGINGTPINFRFLIDHLDTSRFQPWVYYYPSGASLSLCAGHLSQIMDRLRLRFGFKKFFVVAHSMGGLVARGFCAALSGAGAAQRYSALRNHRHSLGWSQICRARCQVRASHSPFVVRHGAGQSIYPGNLLSRP